MKYSTELKIGITGIITLILIVWGINFLKGKNILRSNYVLIALYSQVDGLEASADVMLDGFKIGTVERVEFEPENSIPFTISLEIDKAYRLKRGSEAIIYSSDLLGTKAIKIEKSEAGVYYESGDTIRSSLSEDMISELLDGLPPLLSTVNAAVSTLDSVARSIQVILNDPAIAQILEDLDGVTSSIDEQLSSSGDLSRSFSNLRSISENLNAQNEAISQSITNFEDLSAQLKDAELDSLIKHLSGVGSNLESISKSIESGEGAIGKLIFEDSLYQQISMLMAELDTLVNDINENPKKYVGFSIFGK